MEASRLVFVSVKNARPRRAPEKHRKPVSTVNCSRESRGDTCRKVAVPIPDGYTWEQFCQQIQTKLKLRGVGTIYLVSSGERVSTLDELQDIDELHVEEATPPPSPPAASPSPDRTSSGSKASTSNYNGPSDLPSPKARAQQRHSASPPSGGALDTEAAEKYGRRPGGVRRSLQRLLPGLFAPTLPVTHRDAQDDGRRDSRGRRRRRRASFFAPSNLARIAALLLFIFALVVLYGRMVPRLE